MKLIDTEIPGLKILEPRVFKDERGFFVERHNQQVLGTLGFNHTFVQDNFSRSAPGVVRGLHYQFSPPQGKLVSCTRGRIYDVAVDLRVGEPTFGKHFGIELDGESCRALWVPAGFAHGFCVLGDEPADVFYKVTSIYNAKGELGLLWNDAELGIKWPVKTPLLSPKDVVGPSLRDYTKSELASKKWWLT